MDARCRRSREMSPERTKILRHQTKPITRRVQVVYYLTRNGHIEHPHFMEVPHIANQPLRLRDVMERLVALRGKAMPSLYSWSCKRSYRNGFVWNDLAEDDIVYPSDGAEYVLKGSELARGFSEKFQEFQDLKHHRHHHGQDCKQKPRIRDQKHQQTERRLFEYQPFTEEEEELEEDYEIEGSKKSDTSSTTPHSVCSRGVSTEGLEQLEEEKERRNTKNTGEASGSAAAIISEKPSSRHVSKRFECDEPGGSGPSRSSVLRQLIACGKPQGARRASESLHRGVLCKNVAKMVVEDNERDREVIRCMPENPRFGNLQAEEKEYFSGSIVESVSQDRVEVETTLRRSNSYDEERSNRTSMTKDKQDETEGRDESAKGNCIPLKKISKQTRKGVN